MARLTRRSIGKYLPAFVKQSLKSVAYSLWNLKHSRRVNHFRSEMERIVRREGKDREIIIFAPSVQWDVELFQRPQQLARALARQGALVFYIEPGLSKRPLGFQRLFDGLYLCHVPSATFLSLQNPVVITQAWNSRHIRFLDSPRIVYDYLDDLSVFPFNQSRLRSRHRALVQTAQLVLATAQDLYREVVKERPDSLYCPNGVEYEHFAACRTGDARAPQLSAGLGFLDGKPVVGYYGAIARWFDYRLLTNVAKRRRDLNFLLIGVDWDGTLSRSHLLRESNVAFLGPVAYHLLPDYLSLFRVAIIPFVLNDLTHATSPLKLFEYMAGGKPVVVTPMRECVQYPGVLVGKSDDDFATKLDMALELVTDPQYLTLIDQVASQNTWETRAKLILDALACTESRTMRDTRTKQHQGRRSREDLQESK